LKEKKECDSEGGYLFIINNGLDWADLKPDGKEFVEREEFEDSWVRRGSWKILFPKKAGGSAV
jgi:hypothetical protein